MNAHEAKRIWQEEVAKKAQGFIEYIKKKILQYTYQENVFFYEFQFPDFLKSIRDDEEQEVSKDFSSGIFENITSYFENLGFRVKADNKEHKVWLTYSKNGILEKDNFTENLINIISLRKNYRTFTGIEQIISELNFQIRQKARRHRTLKYPLTLNIPNERSLLLEDLGDIIGKLEQAGFEVSIEGDLANNGPLENKEYILNAINNGMCFEKLEINLIVKW